MFYDCHWYDVGNRVFYSVVLCDTFCITIAMLYGTLCFNGPCFTGTHYKCCIQLGNFPNIQHYHWHNAYNECMIILPAQGSGRGSISFIPSVRPSICLSVRPTSCVHSVASTVLVGSISYLYILSSNFRMCVMYQFLARFRNLTFSQFCKISKFDFVFFWLGISCESLVWVIMRRWRISERRHSSCSSLFLLAQCPCRRLLLWQGSPLTSGQLTSTIAWWPGDSNH